MDIIGMYTGPPLVVHEVSKCAGHFCCIHRPSRHPLATAPLNWRGPDIGMERICEHGIGHPDPDDLAHRESAGLTPHGIHGCDGCCYDRFISTGDDQ